MPTILTEQLDLTEAQYNASTRTLSGVKLISAGTSLNRRHYSEDVLIKAAPLFEGAKAYDSHVAGSRSIGALTGYYKNVRYESGALRADRVFSNTQAGRDVQAVVEDIINGVAPRNLAGLSINAVGNGKTQKLPDGGDGLMVESITKVRSVDDVDTPAAGGSYTENRTGDDFAAALIEAMTVEEITEARPDLVKRLHKEWSNARDTEAVKAANAEADQARVALKEAEAKSQALEAERDAARVEAQEARHALAVEQLLTSPKVKLPATWREDIRKKLLEVAPDQWSAIIESEQKKAKSADMQRVPVTGAGQSVAPALTEAREETLAAPDWERVLANPQAFADWQQLVNRR